MDAVDNNDQQLFDQSQDKASSYALQTESRNLSGVAFWLFPICILDLFLNSPLVYLELESSKSFPESAQTYFISCVCLLAVYFGRSCLLRFVLTRTVNQEWNFPSSVVVERCNIVFFPDCVKRQICKAVSPSRSDKDCWPLTCIGPLSLESNFPAHISPTSYCTNVNNLTFHAVYFLSSTMIALLLQLFLNILVLKQKILLIISDVY